jgi:hypothetical protein
MFKHIILMKAKSTTTEKEMGDLMSELAGLKNLIEGIVDFTGGKEISNGPRTHGFTHGFVMTFTERQKLEAYGPHPEHQKVAAKVRALSEDILAFDYEY